VSKLKNIIIKTLSIAGTSTVLIGSMVWAGPLVSWSSAKKETTKVEVDSPATKSDTNFKVNNWWKPRKNAFELKMPPNYQTDYSLDTNGTGGYNKTQKVGSYTLGKPENVSFDEFLKQKEKEQNKEYFQRRSQATNFSTSSSDPTQKIKDVLGLNNLPGWITGPVEIKPSGSAELTFGGSFNTVRNPSFNSRQQHNNQFLFNQKVQLNVTGNIGDKIKINTNFSTDAIFDFENLMKINWQGKEDDIVKEVAVGNVSLPLNNSLIPSSQSLFGAKVKMQFGRLTVTSLFSQQRAKTQEVELQGGSQVTPFDIQADQYDQNRHYFLSQYFHDNYEQWLSRPPLVQSPIQITRAEVWVTNRTASFENSRDVLSLMDIGELSNNIYNKKVLTGNNAYTSPDNSANNLYSLLETNNNIRSSATCINEIEAKYTGLKQIEDYQLINYARQLNATEFTLNARLGFISLNQSLNNDEVLAVAYEYIGQDGRPHQVGEFSRNAPTNIQSPNVLFLKMLKPVSIRPDLPTWKLMMKNVYSLGSYQIEQKDFKLGIIYADDPSNADLPYLPVTGEPRFERKTLLQNMNLDRVNVQNEPVSDGQFDWVEGITVLKSQGKIIFPLLEPFGRSLRNQFKDPNGAIADYYAFDALYDSTRWAAQQQALKNKFFIRGSFQGSATNEIMLNALNIPKGSVKVTYNGQPLQENVDYTVDYTLGRVKILNGGLMSSGGTIKATYENNVTFGQQQKTLYGSRFDYRISNDFNLGATLLHLRERPLTPKVNMGDEPLSNSTLGFDGKFKSDARFITKFLDRLPFIATKEMSNISLNAEYAKLIPSVAPAIRKSLDPTGVSYLDDFEAAETPYDLRIGGNNWQMASTPQDQPDIFPDGIEKTNKGFRNHAAKIAWYTLDPIYYRIDNLTPASVKTNINDLSNHYYREVRTGEIFPNKQIQAGYPQTLQTFDLAYFPDQRGIYNMRTTDLENTGRLKQPNLSWGGVMRKIETNDFEQANIDYIEVWMMDPFAAGHSNNVNNSGQLYIQLGNVSEDVLRDNRKSFENGLPANSDTNATARTSWGRVPKLPAINRAFNNDPKSRNAQDVGIDGMNDDQEKDFNQDFLNELKTNYGPTSQAYLEAIKDPSSDNYHFHRGSDYDSLGLGILARQKKLNGPDGNSPSPNETPAHQPKESYPVGNTQLPNDEDINGDFTLNEIEEYYQYRINLNSKSLVVGENYITDRVKTPITLANKKVDSITWYQFKIPVRSYERRIGAIPDFKSIRFMRLVMAGFSDSVIVRFGAMNLVRADWRKYLFSLENPGDITPLDPDDNTSFIVSTVNIEKNRFRKPVNYVLPPGIFRTIDPTTPNPIQNNEQSLSVAACNLKDGDARAVFKNTRFDIRNYKNLKLFVHAEALKDQHLNDGDLHAFVRIGTDFTNNYYEYEIPLKVTPEGSTDELVIWPESNQIKIVLEDFVRLKLNRIRRNLGATAYYEEVLANGNRISVIGIPDLSNVRVMLLGIRNPKQYDTKSGDDGLPKCGEVWFNEMRVSDFDNPGGWAALGRANIKLADLGTLNISGSITTVGYGAIDKKLNERARNNTMMFDINTNLELGKLFPVKSGVSIPFFYGFNRQIIRPHFYPLNPDVPMDSLLDVYSAEQASIAKKNADDFTSKRSWNLTNVHKNRTGKGKPKPWDIANLNLSYSVQELYKRNQTVEYNRIKNYQLLLNYQYQYQPKKPIEPFKWVGKSKYLQLIRDFNFYPLPQSFSINTQTDRRYGELQNRSNDINLNTKNDTFFDKNFTSKRIYDVKWDLSKSLKINYNAIVQARFDEPKGEIFTYEGVGRDSIIKNIKTGGRITDYNQTFGAAYTLPLNKLPLTNWITASVNYAGTYNWKTPGPSIADTVGNSISNSQTKTYNAQFNFTQLYSKVPFLDKIQKGTFGKKTPKKDDKKKEVKEPEKGPKKPGDKKEKTKPKKVAKKDKDGKPVVENEEEEKKKVNPLVKVAEYSLRILTMVKSVNFNYSENNGTGLGGFIPKPQFSGQNTVLQAPGYPFIFGSQDPQLRYNAAENGWLTHSRNITVPFVKSTTINLTGSATLEPIPDLRIQLKVNRTFNDNYQSFFQDTSRFGLGQYADFAPLQNGSFSMSGMFLNTSFALANPNASELFDAMQAQRQAYGQQLQNEDPRARGKGNDTAGFPIGYGPLQQDVLIRSFLSAYTGQTPGTYKHDLLPKMPKPNWTLNYNGLTKIKALGNIFNSINITHAYSATYRVNQFGNSLRYGYDTIKAGHVAEPKMLVQGVTLNESFSPLIGVDVSSKKNFTARFEYKRDRTLILLTQNPQLTETKNSEVIIGMGYKAKGVKLPFKIRGGRIVLENELNFRFDFSIRDSWTIIRKFDVSTPIPASGNKLISIKPEINYNISDKLTLKIFFDRKVTKPYTSNSYPTAITQFGLTFRYTLQ
jgi:cell surface protein SprA